MNNKIQGRRKIALVPISLSCFDSPLIIACRLPLGLSFRRFFLFVKSETFPCRRSVLLFSTITTPKIELVVKCAIKQSWSRGNYEESTSIVSTFAGDDNTYFWVI